MRILAITLENGARRPKFTPPGWDDFISREHGDETTVYFNYTLYENGTSVYYGVHPNDYMPDVLTTKWQKTLPR